MFTALKIENFRGFGDLSLDGLGQVNLIVGKNNTGKTSLLEAITLLANQKMIAQLPSLFRANAGQVGERFYRWLLKDGAGLAGGIDARTPVDREQIARQAGWASLSSRSGDEEGRRVVLAAARPDGTLIGGAGETAPPGVKYSWGNEIRLFTTDVLPPPHKVHAVSVQHPGPDSMVDAFAEAVRAPVDERQMEALLASVDPRIRSVRLDAVQSKPFIVVDVGLTNRVPLSQAGQGIYRLVAIFSELLGSKPDICFIDEIENGIHYTALPAVWKGIAEVAARLDIQVFATTHSWECLVAANEAFAARETYDLRVVQLYRLGEAISGRVLDRDHIEAAIAGEIELR